jgi:hypothetical protein
MKYEGGPNVRMLTESLGTAYDSLIWIRHPVNSHGQELIFPIFRSVVDADGEHTQFIALEYAFAVCQIGRSHEYS